MAEYNGKAEILADLERRVSEGVLERSNFDLLKKLVENADNLDEAIKIAELGTTYKRTGFHFDKRLERTTNTVSYLKKNKKLSFATDENAQTHKLIIGDNYPALLNLLVEYNGAINIIYIDPPYGKDSMGEFAETNYDNAITRDNLLSMLYPRLYLAKQLLADTGVIFCSIDDKNQAYVKGLFDEVLDESNFVGCISRATGTTTGQDASKIGASLDYLLVYRRTEQFSIERIELSAEDEMRFSYEDDNGKYSLLQLRKTGNNDRREDRPNMYFAVKSPDSKEVYPIGPTGYPSCWRFGRDTYNEYVASDLIVWQKSRTGEFTPYVKYYLEGRTKQVSNLWDDIAGNKKGTIELKEVLGERLFSNPKPLDLIKKVIKVASADKNATILDFFCGSGTTGQAVLELNKEDGGKRQFILVTNNENGIAENVTSKRLKRVMTGECYNGKKDFKWNEKNNPLGDNLLVCDIAEVNNFEHTVGKTAFDVIDETLYGQKKLNNREKIDWVCKNFEITQKRLEEM